MVLQNPMTCFDPLYRIGNQMAETFATHTTLGNAQEIRSPLPKDPEPDADLKWRRSFAKIPPPAFRWYAPAHYDRYCHGIAARTSDR